MRSLRGLAALDPKQIEIANRYIPIAEQATAINVPLLDLLIDARPRKKRNKTENVEKTGCMPHDDCECCPSQMQKIVHKVTKGEVNHRSRHRACHAGGVDSMDQASRSI